MAIGRMRVLGVLSWMAGMAVFLQLAACSASPATPGRGTGSSVGSSCSPENVTQACVCADQNNAAGSQACTAGAWMACQCAAAPTSGTGGGSAVAMADSGVVDAQKPMGATSDPPGNSSPVRFDWYRAPVSGGSCEAGHYVGKFTGNYYTAISLLGALPVSSTDSAATLGGPILPGLEFTLNKKPGSEILAISGGKIRGTANGLYPFEIDLLGNLDCSTGKFTGTMDGWYSVAGIKTPFLGTVTADYNKITHQFINGKWTLHEPQPDGGFPPIGMPPGGSGDWNANLTKP